MMYVDGDVNWVAWLAMSALMVLFWGGVVWVLVSVLRTDRPSRRRDPVEVLDQRLASGEISKDEYVDLRSTLER